MLRFPTSPSLYALLALSSHCTVTNTPLSAPAGPYTGARPSSSPSYGRRLLGRSLAEWPLTGGSNAYTATLRPSLFDPVALPTTSTTGLFGRPLSPVRTGGSTGGSSALSRAFNSSFGTSHTGGLFGSRSVSP